jgi:uncharacterized protein (DUF305 family)
VGQFHLDFILTCHAIAVALCTGAEAGQKASLEMSKFAMSQFAMSQFAMSQFAMCKFLISNRTVTQSTTQSTMSKCTIPESTMFNLLMRPQAWVSPRVYPRWWGVMAVVASANLLIACAAPVQQSSSSSADSSQPAIAQNSASPGTTAAPPGTHGMDHGSMDHAMDLGPADAEFDLRFIDAMTPHHQGAIVMAQEAQQKSKRPEILALANAILKAQDPEIVQMQQWRRTWYPKASAEPIAYHRAMGHSMPMTEAQKSAMMMQMDLGAADAQFDLRFINAMVPHHEAAVTMAEAVLKQSQRPEMKQMAQAIITSQQAEINQMKQWRKAWYGQ